MNKPKIWKTDVAGLIPGTNFTNTLFQSNIPTRDNISKTITNLLYFYQRNIFNII